MNDGNMVAPQKLAFSQENIRDKSSLYFLRTGEKKIGSFAQSDYKKTL